MLMDEQLVAIEVSKSHITNEWVGGAEVLDGKWATVHWTVRGYGDSPGYTLIAECMAARSRGARIDEWTPACE